MLHVWVHGVLSKVLTLVKWLETQGAGELLLAPGLLIGEFFGLPI